ncbi:MAG: hypothetical protein E7352_04940 [Clostridiales bacterium]|nr:hypothetical protein [Clostridiales bacterium]
MFDYTQAAFKKIMSDFKKIRVTITVGVHLLSIVYLIYALATQTGFLAVNIALLSLTATYFVFFLIMEGKLHAKKLKRRVKKVYGWCKRLIKLPVLGIAVYGLALSKTHFDPLSFLMTLLMIIGWILDILFYFIIRFIEIEKAYLLDSLHRDVEEIPLVGQKISNSIPLSDNSAENYERLSPLVAQVQAERKVQMQTKAQAKIDAKERKKQAKLEEKEQKRAEKLLRKAELAATKNEKRKS